VLEKFNEGREKCRIATGSAPRVRPGAISAPTISSRLNLLTPEKVKQGVAEE
jgi:hypothetical protein